MDSPGWGPIMLLLNLTFSGDPNLVVHYSVRMGENCGAQEMTDDSPAAASISCWVSAKKYITSVPSYDFLSVLIRNQLLEAVRPGLGKSFSGRSTDTAHRVLCLSSEEEPPLESERTVLDRGEMNFVLRFEAFARQYS